MAAARITMGSRTFTILSNVLAKQVRRFSGELVSSSKMSGEMNDRVGFIGLGKMGKHMVRNLMAKGHKVVVYDIFPESINEMQKEGADVAQHPAELAEKANRIMTMLPSTASVIEVYDGSHGILRTVKPGTLMIDSSTVDPSQSQEIAELAEELKVSFVDAPVSGGVIAAKTASLTFMVGGDQKDFEKAKDLLQCLGKNIIHCGEVGTGQAVKICNNMLLGISMIGVAETMNLGIRLGLDPKLLAKIINSSSGRCWASEVYNPVPGIVEGVPSNNNYEGGFKTSLMAKDLGLAQASAISTLSPTPLGSAAYQVYRLMEQRGFSKKDFGAAFQFIQESKDTKPPPSDK